MRIRKDSVWVFKKDGVPFTKFLTSIGLYKQLKNNGRLDGIDGINYYFKRPLTQEQIESISKFKASESGNYNINKK